MTTWFVLCHHLKTGKKQASTTPKSSEVSIYANMFDAWKSDLIRAHMELLSWVLCVAVDCLRIMQVSRANSDHYPARGGAHKYQPAKLSCNCTNLKASRIQQLAPLSNFAAHCKVHLADEHSPILGDTAYGWHHMNRRYAQLAQRPMWLEICHCVGAGIRREESISSTLMGCGMGQQSRYHSR